MGIDEQVAALKRDAAGAQARHAQALASQQQAGARAEAVRELLREEFGVTTLDDARKLLAELDAQLEELTAQARSRLAASGGEP